MTTQEIANRLVELCRQGQFEQAVKELYSEDVVSIEPEGSSPTPRVEGLEGLIKKGEQFKSMVEETHGGEVSDPVVSSDFFSLMMSMDATFKGMGRIVQDEICVYQVKDGKIISEQFFFVPNMGQ